MSTKVLCALTGWNSTSLPMGPKPIKPRTDFAQHSLNLAQSMSYVQYLHFLTSHIGLIKRNSESVLGNVQVFLCAGVIKRYFTTKISFFEVPDYLDMLGNATHSQEIGQ